jgi:hypothetical protein
MADILITTQDDLRGSDGDAFYSLPNTATPAACAPAFSLPDPTSRSRSRQACMTCHFFRHYPGPNCIPLLTCHLHQGLIAHGEHLTHRCSGWTEDLHRQRGWAPEVA